MLTTMIVLVIDVGGSHVKVLASNCRTPIKVSSGPHMTPARMVRDVKKAVGPLNYDVVSIGYPGVVLHGHPASEPRHLASGWVGFDFRRAFHRPVKIMNDATMQAWGGYRGGRMLFLGLGTGLGTALIVDGVLESMELAHLPYKKGRTYEEYLGNAGRKRLGLKKWRRNVMKVIAQLRTALEVDDVVIGGDNVKRLNSLPKVVRRGTNANAFRGGVRAWHPQTGRRSSAKKRPL